METMTLTLNDNQLMSLLISTEDNKKYWQKLWQNEGLKVDREILSNYCDLYRQLIHYKPNLYKKTIHLTKHKYELINKEVK